MFSRVTTSEAKEKKGICVVCYDYCILYININ